MKITLEIDDYDVGVLEYALSQRLNSVNSTIALLKIVKDNNRDLTKYERMMLPWQLSELSRDELLENINHWVGLKEHIEYILKDINKAAKAVKEIVYLDRIEEGTIPRKKFVK